MREYLFPYAHKGDPISMQHIWKVLEKISYNSASHWKQQLQAALPDATCVYVIKGTTTAFYILYNHYNSNTSVSISIKSPSIVCSKRISKKIF